MFDFTGKETTQLDVSENSRIKALEYVKPYVVTATSSGDVNVWNVEKQWDLVSEIHAATDANLTCLAVAEIREDASSMKDVPEGAKRSKDEAAASGTKRRKPNS